jgi:hypothetical protein
VSITPLAPPISLAKRNELRSRYQAASLFWKEQAAPRWSWFRPIDRVGSDHVGLPPIDLMPPALLMSNGHFRADPHEFAVVRPGPLAADHADRWLIARWHR